MSAASAIVETEPWALRQVPPLVALAKTGDRRAFAQLLAEHYDLIYRIAYKWLGHRSDAEDAAQEVCLKLARAIGQFDGRSSFSSWLYRITLNVVRDLQRSSGRDRRRASAFGHLSETQSAPDQESHTALNELWARVRLLPPQQRDAVLLVYAEDLSHARAAEVMGCKEATVSFHLHQARKALKGLL